MQQPQQPVFSVVMPVYNVRPWLEDAIGSVLRQTFQDFELICVDDGSTDGSEAIVDRAAERDSRVVVVHQPNAGLGAARNTGLRLARGEFVYFMDSDDMISAELLERALSTMRGHDVDLYAFGADIIAADDEPGFRPSYPRDRVRSDVVPGAVLALDMERRGQWYPSAWLYIARRELYLSERCAASGESLFFPTGVIHEDNAVTPVVYALARRALCVDEAFFHRRVRSGSIMTSLKAQKSARGYWVANRFLAAWLSACATPDAQRFLKGRIRDALETSLEIWQSPRGYAAFVCPEGAGCEEAQACQAASELANASLRLKWALGGWAKALAKKVLAMGMGLDSGTSR